MPFVPHTAADVDAMLTEIDAPSIEALFDEIPQNLATGKLTQVPEGMSELAMLQMLEARARQDDGYACFLGAGSYDHHIPAAVWDLTSRGEFMTAYTPYQAEASQGTLQLIYEYQSMMAALTGMDVSNASVYDGASGLAEAMLMAMRSNKKNKSGEVWVAGTVHPHYAEASRNIVRNQGITLVDIAAADGGVDMAALPDAGTPVAVVIQQPNFFGCLEQIDSLTDWAHSLGALVIAVVNPMTLAVLKPPGEWGSGDGVDIVCGDGQVLGVPMASGGPSFGFMCCRDKFVRQMPGRIIGKTVDLEGRDGYALTLQAREQHIRRGKATSNICTNQGLLVTAGTIFMALMGPQGLRDVAIQSHRNAATLRERLLQIPGVSAFSDLPFLNEFTLRLGTDAAEVATAMRAHGILAGLNVHDFVAVEGGKQVLLVAVTEKRTDHEIDAYVDAMASILRSAA
ncbi:MAG: aminomethyl-transferring glycine dehydrogenase subunit GcvPA [Pseudomonadales bacterium]|nr:aminomethyl-transferring glycine dehydrogenase subunit GcvPA [Pseudomonadales bacterium]